MGNSIYIGDDPKKDFKIEYRKRIQDVFQKFPVNRIDEAGNYIVNIRNPLPLASTEFNALKEGKQKGQASADAKKRAEDLKKKGKTPFQPKVKPDVKQGQGVLTNPEGQPITGETLPKDQNEEEIVVSKYLEKIEEYI